MKNFKEKVVYQIYPKSFKDSNGDGIGDVNGITQKLDYLKSLNVDYLWLTPIFVSPQNDNGYDVADYYNIDPLFGTMDDVDELISQADKRGMGLMFDMVFNHTSTSHEWFKKALAGDEKYQDYYIFKDGTPDKLPTNWVSKFGGPAWEYVPALGKWYLHLFDVSQADLNWENPAVREELKNILKFWKNKGIKGFRFDVVNLISKPDAFENDYEGDGRRFYTDGVHVHEYLKELVADSEIGDMITVGEMSSTSIDNCIKYTRESENELSMVFHFQHLKVDYRNGEKWELMDADLEALKKLFFDWQEAMEKNDGWDALFWCNHDQPRTVTRFGDEKRYWKESAKMLAACVQFMRGTPYIYQGEELGMTNAHFKSIDKYRDVESLNYYQILLGQGKTKEEALKVVGARSRDNGRTPMQWNGSEMAGFSNKEPWIPCADNVEYINVETEEQDGDSILEFYKKLINLRKSMPVLSSGKIEFIEKEIPEIIAYRRYDGEKEIRVICNLTATEKQIPEKFKTKSIMIGNYSDTSDILRAYEFYAFEV